ncbi:MAG: undecaprenyl-diphosphate phosphatase [Treponema sp.]
MTIFQSIMLGIIQGVGEFLPISSSGHLELYKYFSNMKDSPFVFDILLHVATLASLCIVFRKKIISLILCALRFVVRKNNIDDKENLSLIALILISTFITAIVGFALKDLTKHLSIKAIPIGFIITSIMLLISSKSHLKEKPNLIRTALILGVAQGISVFPGISRSGMTISVLLMLGFLNEEVAEISFILSIPAILGALVLELRSSIIPLDYLPILVGMLTAFVVGFFALTLLINLLKTKKISYFSFYLLPLSISLGVYFFNLF